ncbi:NYN domain-containing protein [Candidatus Gottesmanbacteria bacterium]|nr:NYN domain-containing protein [Candidatus Gottesmanbacteria bacterium]
MKRSIVIIDGSNFYHKLKELTFKHTSSFDYSLFTKTIAKKTTIIARYYCIGKIKADQHDAKARRMMADQQSLVTTLQKQKFIIQFGYLLKTGDSFHEKGVDVQMAVDLLKGAYRNEYDEAYLVSSDSDLIPAINEVQLCKKSVWYIGFGHKPSYALIRMCQRHKLLTKNDLSPCIHP